MQEAWRSWNFKVFKFEDFISLLNKDNFLKLTNIKLFKDDLNSSILVKDFPYKFSANDNKRNNVYINNI